MTEISFFVRIKQIVIEKLVRPLLLSKEPPVYKARGVAVGLAWAMTPLVGIQMLTVFITWGIASRLKWRFSLPLALAWTWVSNVVTLIPIYYVFYVVGQMMRGQWSEISGYAAVSRLIERVFLGEAPFGERTKEFLRLFWTDWGVSMFLGCVPFIIGGYILGYYLTMRFEILRERHRRKKCSK